MRRKIVAGNWKMNKTLSGAEELINNIVSQRSEQNNGVEVILFPPFTFLQTAVKQTKGHAVEVGAQNIYEKAEGAYTGEVSAQMVASVGARYVLVGHSERRAYFKEDSMALLGKMEMALEAGLLPIYCCGESLEEREGGIHFDTVKKQLEEVIFHLPQNKPAELVIAYEPVWAIGTGKTATPDQAQEMHAFIRKTIAGKFGTEVADQLPVLYGGSCKPDNAEELFAQADIDGGLIGGASLVAKDFMSIVHSFK